MKSNEIFNKTLNKIFNKIHKINNFNKNRFSDKITVNQKIVFSLKNKITAEKIIFILNMIT